MFQSSRHKCNSIHLQIYINVNCRRFVNLLIQSKGKISSGEIRKSVLKIKFGTSFDNIECGMTRPGMYEDSETLALVDRFEKQMKVTSSQLNLEGFTTEDWKTA